MQLPDVMVSYALRLNVQCLHMLGAAVGESFKKVMRLAERVVVSLATPCRGSLVQGGIGSDFAIGFKLI